MIVDLHAHYPMKVVRLKRSRVDRGKRALSRLRLKNFIRSILVFGASLFLNYRSVFSGPRTEMKYLEEGDVGVALSVHYSFFDEFDLRRCPRPGDDYMGALDDQITMVVEEVSEDHGQVAEVVTSRVELKEARAAGRIALVPCVEGGFHLGDDEEQIADSVEALAARGIGYITIAHLIYRGMATAAPAFPTMTDAEYHRRFPQPPEGLSFLGRVVVREMVKHEILIDLSHMSEHSLRDTFDLLDEIDPEKTVPVLATHAGYKFGELEYMLEDWELKKIAERDGVVGLIFAQHQMYDGPPHDPDDDHEVPGWRQKRGVRLAKKTRREDSLKVLRSHINHIKQATGSHRHTAIGTDFDGFIKPTLGGFQDMRDLKHLAPALREHYKPVDVEAICSDNAMRLLTGYWGAG